jgi:PBP1b-binding outer membrane lipoprotein LpoB
MTIKIYILLIALFLSSCSIFSENKTEDNHKVNREIELLNKDTLKELGESILAEEKTEAETETIDKDKELLKEIISNDEELANDSRNKTIEELTRNFDEELNIENILNIEYE